MRRGLMVLASVLLVAVTGVPAARSESAAGTLTAPIVQPNTRAQCATAQYQPTDGYSCPPAAMATAVLANGRVLFWDGLEGMNRVQYNTVAEFGDVAQNDQSRVATISGNGATFKTPSNETGAGTGGHADGVNALLPDQFIVDSPGNDYDLFCSPLVQLPDGRVLSAGGTKYYLEPGVTTPTGKSFGVSELQGLKATRIFVPNGSGGAWQSAPGASDLHYGRWYPTLVTLSNGHVFIASGVTKLLKPLYNDGRPPADSGRNVVETETFDPGTNRWTLNHSKNAGGDPTLGDGSQKSLPLFPRLHLLPDGKVYYDAAGQTDNPAGEGYDEVTWAFAKLYDPATQTWSNMNAQTVTGLPLVGGVPLGFRGSGFSVLLPLTYQDGYAKARVFNGGGVIGPTPGAYVGENDTTINTIDTAHGDALTSTAGPTLLNKRWYGSAVVLPDGEVFVTSGASRDEVDGPGSGEPIYQTELIDPSLGTIKAGPELASDHGRTYHNSAVLLPDGRVLIGGHAPINTLYAYQTDQLADTLGFSKPEADSTFQIYSPPYLRYPAPGGGTVPQPRITAADTTARWGQPLHISSPDAAGIGKVVLVRDPSVTHLEDADQRTVELKISSNQGGAITAAVPGAAVLPPGPYMLFIERGVSVDGHTRYVPSVSRPVRIG